MGSVCVGIGIALSYTLQWTKKKTRINDYFDVYIKRKRAPFQTPSRFKLHSFIFTFRECWQIFKWALCTHYSTLFLLFFFVFYSSVVFTCCLLFQLSCYPKEEMLLCFLTRLLSNGINGQAKVCCTHFNHLLVFQYCRLMVSSFYGFKYGLGFHESFDACHLLYLDLWAVKISTLED